MKNLKLLLATTAILSMGAMAAKAEEIVSGVASLQASVNFVEPVSITQSQALHFGTLLHPEAGQSVIWQPNDSTTEIASSSDAQQVFSSGSLAPQVGIMTYSGPTINLEEGYEFRLFFSSTEIGTQDKDATISLTSGNKTCGSVSFANDYVKMPTATSDSLTNNNNIYIGGVFEVDEDYDNSITYGQCTGSVYTTLVIFY